MLSRRGFIGGLVGCLAAPAIVHASNLMPVKAVAIEPFDWVEYQLTVRRAFVPRLQVQLYQASPWFAGMLHQNDAPATAGSTGAGV